MKSILKLTIALAFIFTLTSCWSDKTTPNYQYMPDMYKSVGYETYSNNPNFANGMTTQLPVDGTIARGQVPYDYDNTNEGYEAAKLDSKNPLEVNEANLENGKEMYTIYCTACHGKTGAGDGILVEREKFLGVPNYKDRDINEGSIYHVIMFGRNMMGSHASQLTAKERWKTTMYVEQLRTDLLK
ncbi:MAG: cytochrome c [Lutibacter sp.]|uniref:c-type cytochrome n=1 Tax=Lutibacter sp. TaxID=1925666 RepID=UPI0019F235BD|nr:cytochrome c [Lutibacter sp.]NOR29354.1 cytochrome c [Lutibacter sp.]